MFTVGISAISASYPPSRGGLIPSQNELLKLGISGIQWYPMANLATKCGHNVLTIKGPKEINPETASRQSRFIFGDIEYALERTMDAIEQYPRAPCIDLGKGVVETAAIPEEKWRSLDSLLFSKNGICLDLMHVLEYSMGRERVLEGDMPSIVENAAAVRHITQLLHTERVKVIQFQTRNRGEFDAFLARHGTLYRRWLAVGNYYHDTDMADRPPIIIEIDPRWLYALNGFGRKIKPTWEKLVSILRYS